jgi:endonuclease YncB( thermonuclease family)
MEAVLGFSLILAIVLAYIVFGAPKADKPAAPPTVAETPPTRLRPPSPSQPKPFDRNTARPAAAAEVLEGPAYVVDGDTVTIRNTQIRLFGVDAPEMNHPFGKKAKWALVRLCKGQTIRAEVLETDAHGRTVAKCWLPDGRDLSAEMVKLGLALDWPKFSGGIYGTMETPDARRKLWLADARQKGRMHVWAQFEARKTERLSGK